MEVKEFLAMLENSIGTRVEIINRSGIHKGVYPSSLLDMKDGKIGLAQPMYRGTWIFMSGVELVIMVKNGENLYEASVFSQETSTKGSPVPILWVVISGEIKKIQRRNFLRVPCLIDGSCYFLGDSSEKNWFPISLKNISLGGVAVSLKNSDDLKRFVKEERYLLAVNLGLGNLFIEILLRNILHIEAESIGAFSFEGLSVCQERMIGTFVRKQELANKS